MLMLQSDAVPIRHPYIVQINSKLPEQTFDPHCDNDCSKLVADTDG